MAYTDPESKRANIEKFVKVGVAVVGLAIAAPIIWLALEGVIALAAFGAVSLVLWGIAPGAAQFVANKRIAILKAVIEANPIETMQTIYLEKTEEFRKQEDAVTTFETEFRNVSDLVERLKKTDPEESESYVAMRDKMEEGLHELRNEQGEAQKELKNAKGTIDKMQRLWTVGCAMNKALAASADAQHAFFQKMKEDVAIDTVRTNLNRAFANLNTSVERRKNNALFSAPPTPKALAEAPQVIDLSKSSQTRVSIKS